MCSTTFLRPSYLESCSLAWLWDSVWCRKSHNMMTICCCPSLWDCFCLGWLQLCCTRIPTVGSNVSPCFANCNYDQSCCSRGALRKGKNDGAPCTAFVAGGGCPGCMGHVVEEDLCMLLEQEQQRRWICLQIYPAGSCSLGRAARGHGGDLQCLYPLLALSCR